MFHNHKRQHLQVSDLPRQLLWPVMWRQLSSSCWVVPDTSITFSTTKCLYRMFLRNCILCSLTSKTEMGHAGLASSSASYFEGFWRRGGYSSRAIPEQLGSSSESQPEEDRWRSHSKLPRSISYSHHQEKMPFKCAQTWSQTPGVNAWY